MLSSLVMVIFMLRFMVRLLFVNVLLVIDMLHRLFSINVMDGLLVHILVVWTVINFDPLLFVAWSLLNVTWVFTTIPESVVMHLLLMLDVVFNWMVYVVLIACLEVRLVRWVQVEVSFVTFVLVAIVLLFVILEILVKHTMMFISFSLAASVKLCVPLSGPLHIFLAELGDRHGLLTVFSPRRVLRAERTWAVQCDSICLACMMAACRQCVRFPLHHGGRCPNLGFHVTYFRFRIMDNFHG